MRCMNQSLQLLTAVCLCQIAAAQMPPAPEGFTWSQCKPMKGFFLLPKGWHFLEEQKGSTQACFITKEKISATAGFQTGVSINLLTNLPKRMQLQPSQYARLYIKAVAEKYSVIKKFENPVGPFLHSAVEFTDTDKSGNTIHMWHIVVANDKTGSAYLVIAESPEKSWKESWPVIDKITSMLGVDDAI